METKKQLRIDNSALRFEVRNLRSDIRSMAYTLNSERESRLQMERRHLERNETLAQYKKLFGDLSYDAATRSWNNGHYEALRNELFRSDCESRELKEKVRSLESAVSDRDARISRKDEEIAALRKRVSELIKDVPFKVGQAVSLCNRRVRIVSMKAGVATVNAGCDAGIYGAQEFDVDKSLLSHIV